MIRSIGATGFDLFSNFKYAWNPPLPNGAGVRINIPSGLWFGKQIKRSGKNR